MIADAGRIKAYLQALRQSIVPGAVVLDIGTGTGIMAMLACQCGAARVYAVDPSDLVDVGRELSALNGYADRIHFIQALSTDIALPEPVEVIVSDLRGSIPLFQRHIPTIVDARRRFLAPGGRQIPRADTLWAAVVESPEQYQKLTAGWQEDVFGLDFRPGRALIAHEIYAASSSPLTLLAAPSCWAKLDYAAIKNPDVQGTITCEVERRGTGHGLLLWFDTMLAPGVAFSNAPGEDHVYGRNLFIWPESVDLAPGDQVTVNLAADLVGDDYTWRWDTRILDQGQPGRLKANFHQSTFYAALASPANLRPRAPAHVPVLSQDGRIDQFVLNLMDGNNSLGDIARRVAAAFPARFAGENEALARVGELSLKYGRPLDNKYLKDA